MRAIYFDYYARLTRAADAAVDMPIIILMPAPC